MVGVNPNKDTIFSGILSSEAGADESNERKHTPGEVSGYSGCFWTTFSGRISGCLQDASLWQTCQPGAVTDLDLMKSVPIAKGDSTIYLG